VKVDPNQIVMEYYKDPVPEFVIPIVLQLMRKPVFEDIYYQNVLRYWLAAVLEKSPFAMCQTIIHTLLQKQPNHESFIADTLWLANISHTKELFKSISWSNHIIANPKYQCEPITKFDAVREYGWDVIWASFFGSGDIRMLQMICDGLRTDEHIKALFRRSKIDIARRRAQIEKTTLLSSYAARSLVHFTRDDDFLYEALKKESEGRGRTQDTEKRYKIKNILAEVDAKRYLFNEPIPEKERHVEGHFLEMDLFPLEGELFNIEFQYIPDDMSSKIKLRRGSEVINDLIKPLIPKYKNKLSKQSSISN